MMITLNVNNISIQNVNNILSHALPLLCLEQSILDFSSISILDFSKMIMVM
jgi:hypothetical protein